MNALITVFPVGNGDMILVELQSGRTILIDVNIRQTGDGLPDVGKELRARLNRDGQGRPYVDAMLLTHPDQDHCRGLQENFHLGPLSSYPTPKEGEVAKVVIREMWSSPMVFRRKQRHETLCSDADAWKEEARRRAKLIKAGHVAGDGDRIQVLGKDEDNRTDGLEAVLVETGGTIARVNGAVDGTFSGHLLAPMPKGTDEEEETRSKNNSSVIVRLSIACGHTANACRYLVGGDAEVSIWERVWKNNKHAPGVLQYNLMQAPHHCSWRSLSWESWSDTKGKAKASTDARSALGQALSGASIIASSKEVSADDSDPPCIGAKREYEAILKPVNGAFLNTATHRVGKEEAPMVFAVCEDGPHLQAAGNTMGVKDASSSKSTQEQQVLATPRLYVPAQPVGRSVSG